MRILSRQKSPPVKKAAAAAGAGGASAPAGRTQAGGGPAEPPTPAAERQMKAFEQAAREFHAGRFAQALRLYEQAANGPSRDMAHSARLHANMCTRRLARPEVSLHTADDHYDYAVTLINQRKLEQAEKHLILALTQNPNGDHLYYALALCRGLSGDIEGARSQLKQAIDLQPRNRVSARNDPDFAEIAHSPRIAELLYPERAGSA